MHEQAQFAVVDHLIVGGVIEWQHGPALPNQSLQPPVWHVLLLAPYEFLNHTQHFLGYSYVERVRNLGKQYLLVGQMVLNLLHHYLKS